MIFKLHSKLLFFYHILTIYLTQGLVMQTKEPKQYLFSTNKFITIGNRLKETSRRGTTPLQCKQKLDRADPQHPHPPYRAPSPTAKSAAREGILGLAR